MFQDKYVFSQLTAFLNRTQFDNYVRKYDGNMTKASGLTSAVSLISTRQAV